MKAAWRCADNEGRQQTNVAETLSRREPICLESGKVGQGWHSLPWLWGFGPDVSDWRKLACGGREWEWFARAHVGSADLGCRPTAALLMVNERQSS